MVPPSATLQPDHSRGARGSRPPAPEAPGGRCRAAGYAPLGLAALSNKHVCAKKKKKAICTVCTVCTVCTGQDDSSRAPPPIPKTQALDAECGVGPAGLCCVPSPQPCSRCSSVQSLGRGWQRWMRVWGPRAPWQECSRRGRGCQRAASPSPAL